MLDELELLDDDGPEDDDDPSVELDEEAGGCELLLDAIPDELLGHEELLLGGGPLDDEPGPTPLDEDAPADDEPKLDDDGIQDELLNHPLEDMAPAPLVTPRARLWKRGKSDGRRRDVSRSVA